MRKLAESGSKSAQHDLGLISRGEGVPPDREEGMKCLQGCTERGYLPAQYSYAELLREDTSVEKNLEESVKWMKSAAEKGMTLAQFSFGNTLFHGDEAQHRIAVSYYHGDGVKKRAVKWLKRSLDNNSPTALRDLRKLFEIKMKPDRWDT